MLHVKHYYYEEIEQCLNPDSHEIFTTGTLQLTVLISTFNFRRHNQIEHYEIIDHLI